MHSLNKIFAFGQADLLFHQFQERNGTSFLLDRSAEVDKPMHLAGIDRRSCIPVFRSSVCFCATSIFSYRMFVLGGRINNVMKASISLKTGIIRLRSLKKSPLLILRSFLWKSETSEN